MHILMYGGWYYWWATVGAEALRYMAEHGHGYPGVEPWDTPEKWQSYLYNMADKLEWCAKSEDDPIQTNWERMEEINKQRRIEIFTEFAKNLGRFWD